MSKTVVTVVMTVAVLIILGSVPSQVVAGPSYSVECEESARAIKLHLFDANPRTGFIAAYGTHPYLPEGMKSFGARAPANPIPLRVARYQPYEVELELVAQPEAALPPLVAENTANTTISTLQKIILENHSPITINQPPCHGAAILVLSNGLHLRFNHCDIIGDVDVRTWEKTFNVPSSN